MNGRFLLDTNIVIGIFAQDTSVQQHLAEAEAVFISSTVIGELYFGAYKSARVEANLTRLEEFVAINAVLACDLVTAQQYGQIKNLLRAKGQPIPENDLWITAVAMQYQLTLVSRDQHFNLIDRLLIEIW